MVISDNKHSERESHPMPYQLNLDLSGSAFLVSFRAPDKHSFRVKSVFKSSEHLSNSYRMNKFTTLFRVKGVVSSCFMQLPLDLNLSLVLFHSSFRERTLFDV